MTEEIKIELKIDKSIQPRYWKGQYKDYTFTIEDESDGVFNITLFVEYVIDCKLTEEIILSAQLSESIEECSFCWIDDDGESHDLLQDEYKNFADLPEDFQILIEKIESELERFEKYSDNFNN